MATAAKKHKGNVNLGPLRLSDDDGIAKSQLIEYVDTLRSHVLKRDTPEVNIKKLIDAITAKHPESIRAHREKGDKLVFVHDECNSQYCGKTISKYREKKLHLAWQDKEGKIIPEKNLDGAIFTSAIYVPQYGVSMSPVSVTTPCMNSTDPLAEATYAAQPDYSEDRYTDVPECLHPFQDDMVELRRVGDEDRVQFMVDHYTELVESGHFNESDKAIYRKQLVRSKTRNPDIPELIPDPEDPEKQIPNTDPEMFLLEENQPKENIDAAAQALKKHMLAEIKKKENSGHNHMHFPKTKIFSTRDNEIKDTRTMQPYAERMSQNYTRMSEISESLVDELETYKPFRADDNASWSDQIATILQQQIEQYEKAAKKKSTLAKKYTTLNTVPVGTLNGKDKVDPVAVEYINGKKPIILARFSLQPLTKNTPSSSAKDGNGMKSHTMKVKLQSVTFLMQGIPYGAQEDNYMDCIPEEPEDAQNPEEMEDADLIEGYENAMDKTPESSPIKEEEASASV